ncbi:hypothetical protein E2C01_038521 [Portunus trituberculatus]|uniref:Uncharacterized protein n=1 Tax=Portunus trituberculatus TaxID=210409 RepID=A0A5B7FCF7_PORTR|nr:hypothetical protein [Portunus trituberculatus]
MIFGQIPEVMRVVRVSKIMTFSVYERVFSKLKNRLGVILGRNYHFCYAFNTQRWLSDTETVIIPGKN